MFKLGLIGYPLSHSLSGVIQTAALNSVGLDGSYELLETHPEDLVDKIKYLKANNYNGFNVTIPHKVPITLFLDSIDESANIAGAVNTVKIMPDKTLNGYNTDIKGFMNALSSQDKLFVKGKKAVILGTGGASRACAVGLVSLGINEIDFYSRNVLNAQDMVNFLRKQFPMCKINLNHYQNLVSLENTAVVVNSTPIGMKSVAADESLLTVDQRKTLDPNAIVYDIVYNPIQTILLKDAKKLGLKTINGLDMLIYQACAAFEIWTGKIPNFDKMKIAALEYFLL